MINNNQINQIRPFDSGTHFRGWQWHNCDTCQKDPNKEGWPTCPILQALLEACFGSGYVASEIANRMGYTGVHQGDGTPPYYWRCGEFEPVSF